MDRDEFEDTFRRSCELFREQQARDFREEMKYHPIYSGMDLAKPNTEFTVVDSDTLPEQCPNCQHEFVFDIEADEPPTVRTECPCGRWRFRILT